MNRGLKDQVLSDSNLEVVSLVTFTSPMNRGLKVDNADTVFQDTAPPNSSYIHFPDE